MAHEIWRIVCEIKRVSNERFSRKYIRFNMIDRTVKVKSHVVPKKFIDWFNTKGLVAFNLIRVSFKKSDPGLIFWLTIRTLTTESRLLAIRPKPPENSRHYISTNLRYRVRVPCPKRLGTASTIIWQRLVGIAGLSFLLVKCLVVLAIVRFHGERGSRRHPKTRQPTGEKTTETRLIVTLPKIDFEPWSLHQKD